MKKQHWFTILLFFNSAVMIYAAFSYTKAKTKITILEFQHTRDSLVIDSLKNPVDTTTLLVEHSELK